MLEYVRVVGVKRRRLHCLEVRPPPAPSLLGSIFTSLASLPETNMWPVFLFTGSDGSFLQ